MLEATGNRLKLIGGLSASTPIDSSPLQPLRSDRRVSNCLVKFRRQASFEEPRRNVHAPLTLTDLGAVGRVRGWLSAPSGFDRSVGFCG